MARFARHIRVRRPSTRRADDKKFIAAPEDWATLIAHQPMTVLIFRIPVPKT